MSDPYDLQRFVDAQERNYARAIEEIRHGRKRSHWMWYVFPQIVGLGRSEMARRYAIASLDEVRAYLDHRLLGTRYRDCVDALQSLNGGSAEHVFGAVDAAKLRSSLTLFEAAGGPPALAVMLARWFEGRRDDATLAMLGADAS